MDLVVCIPFPTWSPQLVLGVLKGCLFAVLIFYILNEFPLSSMHNTCLL
jgi:hypothetical protein